MELAAGIDGLSARILTKQLKEMEQNHLLVRMEYAEMPPRVEYALTERGRSLGPVLKVIAEWGMENMFLNRVKFDDSIEV